MEERKMNAAEFGLKPGQELFEGNYCIKMSELCEAGLTPWSTEDIMDARNAVSFEHPKWNNYLDTDFGIAGTKTKIYLMPHSERLRAVMPQTRLTNGGLSFDCREAAKTYNRSDLILSRDLAEQEARTSPVWLDFADGNQARLDTYVENTFRFGKDKFNYDTMMGIFVPEDKNERAVVLVRLNGSSLAYGINHLNNDTRFVGVRRGESVATKLPQARAKKSPYREDSRSDLEIFLSEHSLSRKELSGAVELYKTVKKLKL